MARFHIIFFVASQLLVSVVDGQCFSDADCSCGEGTNLCQDQSGNQAPTEGSLACSDSAECYCFLSDRRSPSYQGCLRIDGTLSPTTSSPISSAPTTPFPTYEPTTEFPSPLPSGQPSSKSPTSDPAPLPTSSPTPLPTSSPTPPPTSLPTSSPTPSPTPPPTSPPTSSPTPLPTPLPTSSPTPPPTSLPTSSPTPSPTSLPTLPPTPLPTPSPTSVSAPQCGSACPDGASENFPTLNCLGYIQCAWGQLITTTVCPGGTVFDGSLQVCNWEWAVSSCSCTASPPLPDDTPSPTTSIPTSLAPSSMTPTSSPEGVGRTLRPSRDCEEPEEGCGWGIWNIWTCQCDCAVGFCLSANQQCYDGCTTHLDHNPFGGCEPGYDCPWYQDPSGQTHCVSTVNVAGQYNIFRNAIQCCERHFSYLDVENCVADSENSVNDAKKRQVEIAQRPSFYYPDVFGKDNCVYGNLYFEWMNQLIVCDDYLFPQMEDCCSKWYPGREDCPSLEQPMNPDVDGVPYPVTAAFYPHQVESNCRFGRNYPQWMAQDGYVGDYLFLTPEECCETHYPETVDCPLGPDDGVQEGRYWQSDVFFYPYQKEGAMCAVGNDYPLWMSDPTNVETHLFGNGAECCQTWFSDQNVTECVINIVQTIDGGIVGDEPEEPQTWWPTLAYPYDCTSDGEPPYWMLLPGYPAWYIFDSKADCCEAHNCVQTAGLFQ